MYYKQLLWLGSLAAFGVITATSSVSAETNQSDTSGGQTYSSPIVSIDSINGNGVPQTTQYNPATGEIVGGGINNPIKYGSASGSGSGSGSGKGRASGLGSGTGNDTGNSSETGNGSENGSDPENGRVSGKSSGSGSGNKVEVSLNEVATMLENSLNTSLDNLAAIEQESQVAPASAGTRRIARSNSEPRDCTSSTSVVPRRIARSGSKACENENLNPTVGTRRIQNREIEARQVVEQQLSESKKFIEQVSQIEPSKNIW